MVNPDTEHTDVDGVVITTVNPLLAEGETANDPAPTFRSAGALKEIV